MQYDPSTFVVAVTGHRPHKLGGYNNPEAKAKIKEVLRHELLILNPSKTVTGMALGIDLWFAEACIELGIPFVAAVPCDGQESTWPERSQNEYHTVLGKAESVVVVCPGPYAAWKMQARNKWMVDRCNCVLAVWDGSNGGTGNCVRYAQSLSKMIRMVDPRHYL